MLLLTITTHSNYLVVIVWQPKPLYLFSSINFCLLVIVIPPIFLTIYILPQIKGFVNTLNVHKSFYYSIFYNLSFLNSSSTSIILSSSPLPTVLNLKSGNSHLASMLSFNASLLFCFNSE